MGIEKVVEEIVSSAQKEARKIEKSGEEEVKKIISEAEERANVIKKQKIEEVKKIAEEMKKREEALARLEGRKRLMEKRKELTGEILEEIREKFLNLEGKEREEVLKALIKKAGKNWEVVYVSRKDLGFVKKAFKNSKVEEIAISGGFILESADKSVRIDMSFENIFENLKKEIVKALAGENI